ncbi:hypothetical protein BS35_004761 [Actinomadura glauciflava]|uniref:hypothetical protein n=1 Tax=Actinomadura luteofluorescens TaxID=46163 RepID=UPI002164E672|nr:hypothetical protein [Actinomadura glauciflava]MCR3742196.1 hypothetical protein [Actinomadura glauciflava]
MNQLACPRCGQMDQAQSAQSVYGAQSGTSHSTGVAVGGGIGTGPMAMGVTMHGTHVSNLAQRLAPPAAPQRRSAWNCGVFALFGLLIIMGLLGLSGYLLHSEPSESTDRTVGLAVAIVFFCLVPVVIGLLLVQGRRLKRRYENYAAVWPAMMHVWQSAMVCLRCHGAFFPPGAIQAENGAGQLIPLDAFPAVVADIGTRIALSPPASSVQQALPPDTQG